MTDYSPWLTTLSIPVQDASDSRNKDAVCLIVPRWAAATVLGFFTALQNDALWTGTDAQIQAAIDDVGDALVDLAGGDTDCMSQIVNLRYVGSELQYLDTAGNWHPVSGGCYPCNNPSPTLPSGLDTTDNLCAGVKGMVAWLQQTYEDWLDQLQTYIDGLSLFSSIVQIFYEGLSLGAGEAIPIDELTAAFIGIGQVAKDILQNEYGTQAFLEEAQEALYCLIKDQGEPYALTEAIWSNWTATVDTGHNGDVITRFGWYCRNYIGYGSAVNRFALYRADTDPLCEIDYDCGQGMPCVLFDFTNVSQVPDHVQVTTGQFALGQGIKANVQFNQSLGLWEGRINTQFNTAGEAIYIDHVVYTLSMNEPSTLGETTYQFWTSTPFTELAIMTGAAQIFTPQTLTVEQVAEGTNWFIPSFLSPRRSTGQAIIDANWILQSVEICTDAAGAAYLESRFVQHPL